MYGLKNLNAITKKDKYPSPHIDDLLEKLRKAKFYTRVDIISAYNMIRISSGHEWKTAFRTPDGCFELLVMPFRLASFPPTWQSLIDQIFSNLNEGIVSCVDNFLIFAQTKIELHERTIKFLNKLKEKKLYCKLLKCVFEVEEINLLGFVISFAGLRISPKSIATITE